MNRDEYIEMLRDEVSKLKYQLAPQPAAGQVPVEYQFRTRPAWDEKHPWLGWVTCSAEAAASYRKTPLLHDWKYEVRELYTAPQPAEGEKK